MRIRSPLSTFGAALLAVGCGAPRPPERLVAGPPKVTVAKPLVLETLEWDPYTGRLAPIEEVEVRARVSGYLQSHHFQEGQLVEQGQLLFVIDPRPFQATLAQARASQEEAAARRQQAEASVREAEARREQVTARQELTQAQLRRARPLVPSGAISQDEFDELVAAARQAEADAYAADAEIESAKAAVVAAQASLATAEAAVSSAELDLGYCRIEAPLSGRIGRRVVTEGNLVSGGLGATALTTIVSINPIHAYFDASEQALLKYIRLDRQKKRESSRDARTPVYMALADEKGFPHRGYIDFVDNRVDRSTGTIRARAVFANSDDLLTPGVFVRLQLPGSGSEPKVLVPDGALATDQASRFVYVVGEENKIEVRAVTPGAMTRGLRVVAAGLDGSETIVVEGLQRCRPGLVVDPAAVTLEAGDSQGLPDTYQPVPPEEWLTAPPPVSDGADWPSTPPVNASPSPAPEETGR